LSETFLIRRTIQRGIIINVHTSSCKVPGNIIRFERKLNFLDRFSKNTQLSNFTKILSVGADLFHADRQTDRHTNRWTDGETDMMKLIVAFRNFAERIWKPFTSQTNLDDLYSITIHYSVQNSHHCKFNSNKILTYTPRSPKFSLTFIITYQNLISFLFFSTCSMPCPSHPSLFYHPKTCKPVVNFTETCMTREQLMLHKYTTYNRKKTFWDMKYSFSYLVRYGPHTHTPLIHGM
jgi:hypothetical protein